MLRSDRRLWRQDKSNSLVPGRTSSLHFPDKFSLWIDSGYECWSAALQLPESIRGSGPEGFCLISFSYPIPTHSIHNFIALLSTTAASPRKIPTRKNTRPAASKRICVAFSDFIHILLSMFKVSLLLLFTPVSITPLIDTEDACFGLNASRLIAKGDLKWRDELLVAHRVNSNRLLTFRCLHYTIGGVKFLLRKWRKINWDY